MNDEIAVIGMACRAPGADDVEQLWSNLLHGHVAAHQVSRDEALRAGARPEHLDRPGHVRRVHGLAGAYRDFDSAAFGLTGREADLMDPQHRLFAEVLWHAIDDAAVAGAGHGRMGVYAAAGMNQYLPMLLRAYGYTSADEDPQIWLLNDPDFLATRMSYALDLHGPSMSVQSACSSSLVAVHLAARALLADDCDIAVAGGAAVDLLAERGYLYQAGGISSADGYCRPFDAATTGSARGSGAAAVVLKRLSAARADQDRIVAVIRGTAVNNDGRRKAGFTAPSVSGHADAIRAALSRAGLTPGEVSYVEAHGTGTVLGDPIEIRALETVFSDGHRPHGPCRIGSIKANVGHLDAAAGVLGLIKAALVVSHRAVPPQPGFGDPCPGLAGSTVLRVPTATVTTPGDTPVYAGVSSLGFGGTNAHAVLASPPRVNASPASAPDSPVLLLLSAATAWSLQRWSESLADLLDAEPGDERLADIAYTLRTGRRHLGHRRAVVGRTAEECAAALREPVTTAGGPPVVTADGGHAERYARLGIPVTATGPVDEAAFLTAAGRFWTAGGEVDWRRLDDAPRRRLSLPAYPFDRRRHWPLAGEATPGDARVHRRRWDPVPPAPVSGHTTDSDIHIVGPAGDLRTALADALGATGRAVTVATAADPLPGGDSPLAVIDLTGFTADPLDTGGYARLVRRAAALRYRTARLTYVAAGVFAVSGTDVVSPSHALALGPVTALSRESTGARGALLDLDRRLLGRPAAAAQAVATALARDEPVLAVRDGSWLVPGFEPVTVAAAGPGGRRRWLITGGSGGIAGALAERLRHRHAADTVILVSRSPIVGVRRLGDTGPDDEPGIRTVQADLTDPQAVHDLHRRCETVLGGIDVVLHLAGDGGGQTLTDWDPDLSTGILTPKVTVTDRLLAAFTGATVVGFSSLTSVKPVAGASDYIAANSYLNALADTGRPGRLTIAWPAWRGLGMARRSPTGIDADTGLDLVLRLLGTGAGTYFVDADGDRLTEPRPVLATAPGPGDVTAAIVDMWAELLGFRIEDPRTDVFDAGADSFTMLRILDLIEQRWPVSVALDELFACQSVADQADLITQRLGRQPDEARPEGTLP
ncbi:SDR family NAD(P)-dependent oxidoreductase [Actinoplanes sp. G11-F43]|uniref:SDR family NAD(P)-dependent oxidoreductase n=1 Tax=Actinoplanes sp. G11-F43 TaxID=3424130 RepID=UPI003D35617B